MVCQDASANNNSNIGDQSFVNITQLVVDEFAISIKPTFQNPDIVFVDNPNQVLNLSHWNVLDFDRNRTFPYVYQGRNLSFNVTILFQCQVILPPKDRSFKFGYLQNYIYGRPGLGEIDPTLASFNEDINIPEYMSKQFRYKIIHRIFHFDALYNSIKNRYPNVTENSLTLNEVSLAAFSYGTTIYAAPWSITNFILSLITHKYLKNNPIFAKYTTIDSFDVNTISTLSDIEHVNNPYYPWDADSSIISFNHFPHEQNEKLTGSCNASDARHSNCGATQNFYHQYDEEYLDYTFFDLLSGLGGIVTGAYSFSAMIIKFLLYGFSCCKWKFTGLAPYPSMSEQEMNKLKRHQKMESGSSGNRGVNY